MVSGVSLKGADTVLVLLENAGSSYLPAALGIKGKYNRLGGIDMIEEDESVNLIEGYFQNKLRSGELKIEDRYLQSPPQGFSQKYSAEWFIEVLERNINEDPQAAVLNGRPLVFALICKAIWNSITSSAQASDASDENLFSRLFDGRSIPSAIYNGGLTTVRPQLAELYAITEFFRAGEIVWIFTEADSQHYDDEMNNYLSAAREAFAGDSFVLRGLDDYESEVEDLLAEA